MTTGQPSWQQVARAAVKSSKKLDVIRADVAEDLYGLIVEAASRRRMPVTRYVRRAVLAFVVHDLHLDWWKVMADEQGLQSREKVGGLLEDLKPGEGGGPWMIEEVGHYERPS